MNNHITKVLGVSFLVIGLGLCVLSFSSLMASKQSLELSNISIENLKPHHLNWSPMIGLVIIGIGCIILWQSYKKTNRV